MPTVVHMDLVTQAIAMKSDNLALVLFKPPCTYFVQRHFELVGDDGTRIF